jgi:catabolite repression HPr-like protein
MVTREVTVCREDGLEARPIAMLVQKASQFSSTIHIEVGNKKVNAKSIMGMMSLSVCSGDEVVVIANGTDEEDAVNAIEAYLKQ